MQLDINIGRMKSFIDKHLESVPSLPGGIPVFSSIEFSICGACNRTCSFCPRGDVERYPSVAKFMSFDLYKKIMNELSAINYTGRISYSGFSEPLLHKSVYDFIRYAKETNPGMTVEITSNGDVLDIPRLHKLFESGLDFIKLSVYDGPEALERFDAMRKEAGLTEKQVILRARYLAAEEHFGLTMSNRAGEVSMPEIGVAALKEPLAQNCYYPYYKMMVDYTGEVLICSNDWAKKLVVADLNNSTVIEAWNSPLFNFARKRLSQNNRRFAPCITCDVNGLYNGENHYAQWLDFWKKNPSENQPQAQPA